MSRQALCHANCPTGINGWADGHQRNVPSRDTHTHTWAFAGPQRRLIIMGRGPRRIHAMRISTPCSCSRSCITTGSPTLAGEGLTDYFLGLFFSFLFFFLSLFFGRCPMRVGGLGVGLASWVRIQDTKLLLVAAGLRECVRARCCWSRCPPSLMSEYQWPLPRCHEESLSGRLPRRGNSAACGPTSLVLGEAPLSPNPMRSRWARFSPRRVNVIIMSVSESVKGKKKTRS